MKSSMKICRKCGLMIDIIETGLYRKTLVDAVPYYVKADPNGEQFLRIDGSKIMAKEVPFETEGTEPAYKPHRCRVVNPKKERKNIKIHTEKEIIAGMGKW